MEKYQKKAILYLVIASILWSIGGLFIKLVNWNPIAIAGARSGIAAIVMLLYLKKPAIHLGKTKLLGACTYSSLLIFLLLLINSQHRQTLYFYSLQRLYGYYYFQKFS